MRWGGVWAGPWGRHPLAGPGVPHGARGEEEAGAGVVAQAAQVVVGEVLAARVGEAGEVAGRYALHPPQVLQQLVVAARAVVAAGAGGQVGRQVGRGHLYWGGQEGQEVGQEQEEAGGHGGQVEEEEECLAGGSGYYCRR